MDLIWITQEMSFRPHPDYLYGKPAYFDVTVRNPLHDPLLSQPAVLAGAAALRGEVEKDAHHEEAVLGAGRLFGCGDPGALVSC